MAKIKKKISALNSKILASSGNKYDLRNFPEFLESTDKDWGLSNVIDHIDLDRLQTYKALINDDEREQLKELLKELAGNEKILYLGSECEALGRIDVESEFTGLQKILTSKYLFLERVETPNISSFIDVWDQLKPKIIFVSCHGTADGLYLLDDNNNCRHYLNGDFINFFKKRSEYTECVILSACESLDLGKMIMGDGKNVVCMNSKIEIATATEYTGHFFKYINDHSLEDHTIYEKAHKISLEKINFEGREGIFSIEFLKADKIY